MPRCSFPGCREKQTTTRYDSHAKGVCPIHGRWVGCYSHEGLVSQAFSKRNQEGSYARITLVRPNQEVCLLCLADEIQEAGRRNSENTNKYQSPLSGYIAEFRGQGYGQEAAEALANKRLREQPRQEITFWTFEDIHKERMEAERQRKIRAGLMAACPRCGFDVPVSQGIILAHQLAESQLSDQGSLIHSCSGEGLAI
jgi:hypothetical protein